MALRRRAAGALAGLLEPQVAGEVYILHAYPLKERVGSSFFA